jgi:hypothetical protein
VDGEDEEFAHGANGTITAGNCKTARRGRIASHYEFAIHKRTRATTEVAACDLGSAVGSANSSVEDLVTCQGYRLALVR